MGQLEQLLRLRERAEEEAEGALRDALQRHGEAKAAHQRLLDRAREADAHRQEEAQKRAARGNATVATLTADARFVERLKAAAQALHDQASQFENQELVVARESENAARLAHVLARQEREAIEKHIETLKAQVKVVRERKEEDAASDLALARYKPKT